MECVTLNVKTALTILVIFELLIILSFLQKQMDYASVLFSNSERFDQTSAHIGIATVELLSKNSSKLLDTKLTVRDLVDQKEHLKRSAEEELQKRWVLMDHSVYFF